MAACSTIGTPIVLTVNSPAAIGCELSLLLSMLWFSIYDIRYKRVPNKALVLFLPIFLIVPFATMFPIQSELDFWVRVAPMLTQALLGAITGFGILLLSALIANGGIGGGDIKLAALLGFACGPYRTLSILLIATVLCIPTAAIVRRKRQATPLSMPFVPFLAVGSLLTAIIIIINKGV